MSTTTNRLTYDEFLKLPEREGTHYELDEGELVLEHPPTFLHNRIRGRIATKLSALVEAQRLGEVIVEMDFRLGPDTVRNPDVAFVTAQHLETIDVNRSPVEGAPALAVEVVSTSYLAQDMAKKVNHYLAAGTRVVWVVQPVLQWVEAHSASGVRYVKAPESLVEEQLFDGHPFSLSLQALFSSDPYS